MDWFRHRRQRGRPRHPDILTPAEWRVLEHVREGATNAETAVCLGLSINTVRYHVSSMVAKLELRDRRELAGWDGEPQEASRAALRRSALAAPFLWLRDVGAAKIAAVVAVSVAAVVVMSQLQGAGDGGAALPTQPPAMETATPPPERVEPSGGPGDLLMPFEGVSVEPGPLSTPTREVSLGDRPTSPFAEREDNSFDVILYDLESMTEENVGPGRFIGFSPAGTRVAWVTIEGVGANEGDLHVMDLNTREVRVLAQTVMAHWVDEDHMIIAPSTMAVDAGEAELVDVRTGERGGPAPGLSAAERRDLPSVSGRI